MGEPVRAPEQLFGRRESDELNARIAQTTGGVNWLMRWVIGALLLSLVAVAGLTTTQAFSQMSILAARLDAVTANQAADARDLGALKARADANDTRLSGIDRKLDNLDTKLDRILVEVRR